MPTRPSKTLWFCGNCEGEFPGNPYGRRIPDERPLCERCVFIGMREGWAVSEAVAQRIEAPPFRLLRVAILLLSILAAGVAFAFYTIVVNGGRR